MPVAAHSGTEAIAELDTKGSARPNRYAKDVRAHRAAWEKRAEHDYVLVVDMTGNGRSYREVAVRVVVRAGRPVSAEGVRYGWHLEASRAPTMSAVYDEVERAAGSGDGGVPVSFQVTYDTSHDVVTALQAHGRPGIGEDHTYLTVYCYSTDAEGCRLRELAPRECAALDGVSSREGHCPGNSVGRVAGAGSCCVEDDAPVSDSACERAGGQVRFSCERTELSLGASESPGQKCCRSFLVEAQ